MEDNFEIFTLNKFSKRDNSNRKIENVELYINTPKYHLGLQISIEKYNYGRGPSKDHSNN